MKSAILSPGTIAVPLGNLFRRSRDGPKKPPRPPRPGDPIPSKPEPDPPSPPEPPTRPGPENPPNPPGKPPTKPAAVSLGDGVAKTDHVPMSSEGGLTHAA